MGHEFTGEVASIGSQVKKFNKGENVLVAAFLCLGHL